MRTPLLICALSAASTIAGCSSSDPFSAFPQESGGTAAVEATGGARQATGAGGSGTSATGGTSSLSSTSHSTGGVATGGQQATGGAGVGGTATGGNHANGGATVGGTATGGNVAAGGARSGNGGAPATGGARPATGGSKAAGGAAPASGGAATGGARATGGAATGGGRTTSGNQATGGGASTNTSTSTSTSTSTDVNCSAPMPTGGTQHTGNTRGGSGNLAWEIWRNGSGGSITTFSTPAFGASWSNSGDFLARIGLEWGNSGKAYSAYGTIKAQFTYTKTGTGGGYSYIGVYGWSTNPCVEYYIIDDSFNGMPFTPWNSSAKGSATIDGETYKFYSNNTNGTGGSRCGSASSWLQHWSVRQKARQCGTMTISDHFKAWDAAGMKLGTMLEAKILVETGGGSGSVNFPIANVSAQ